MRKNLLFFYIMLLVIFPQYAHAFPKGGQVVAGQAQINQVDTHNMHVNQATNKAIINWKGFSIARPEAVKFLQPGSGSVALNRVTGGDPSEIFGLLQANGGIFLINPNGILVGPSGEINVNTFVASTLDISNEDFLAENYRFTQNPNKSLASIANQGIIQAAEGGHVSLMAPAVRNEGLIFAELGKVFIGAGERVTLNFEGNDLIGFAVDESIKDKVLGPDGKPLAESISNTGEISADGGQVILSAKTAYEAIKSVVNNEGVIEARTLVSQNGVIKLMGGDRGIVANSGVLDASGKEAGQTGGTVHVLGEKVGLFDNAVINVSGDAGGGTVLMGGDFQGKNPDIPNASNAYVSSEAAITADALTDGDGGEVIVWADETTRVYGAITARGGDNSGAGGFIETSGGYLDIGGALIDASGQNGIAGEWLLDPHNITISTDPSVTVGSEFAFQSTADGSNLNIADLLNALGADGAGADVSITTGDGGAETGDITLATVLDFSSIDANRTLTLNAHDDIIINFPISHVAGTFSLNLDFNANDATGGGAPSGAGSVNINAAINTNGGFFQSSGVNFDNNVTGAGTIDTGAGSFALDHTGTVVIDEVLNVGSLNIDAGSTIGIDGAITVDGTVAIDAAGLTTIAATGDINAGGAVTFGATLGGALSTAGDIDTGDDNVTFTNAVTLTGNVDIDTAGAAAGSIAFNSTVATGGNNLALDAGPAGNITLAQALTGGGDLTVRDGAVQSYQALTINSLNIQDATTSVAFGGDIAATTTIDVNSGGTIAQTAAVASGTNLDYDAGSTIGIDGAITVDGTVAIDAAGLTTIAATGDINAGGAVTFGATLGGALSTAGDIDTGDDNVTFTNAVTLTGNVDIDTSGAGIGNIIFSDNVLGNFDLTLTAGTGDIDFDGAVGAGTPLSGLQVVSAANLDFENTVAVDDEGIDITAGTVNINNTVTTTSNGALEITNAGLLTITAAGDMTLDGSFTQNGAGTVIAAGNITTSNDNISLAAALTLTGDVALSTGAGIGTITYSDNVQGNFDLTLTAGTGDILFSGNVGNATPLASLTATGATIGLQNVTTTGEQNYTGTTTLNSAYITAGGTWSVTGDTVLADNTTVDTTNGGAVPAGADILFNGALDATTAFTETLGLTAGRTGDVLFAGLVGNTTPLGAITVSSAENVTANGVRSSSFVQNAGDGTTTLNLGNFTAGTDGAIATNAAAGVNIINESITVNAGIITTGSGIVTLNADTATLTIAAAGEIVSDGAISLTGAAGIDTSGNVTATNPITYNSGGALTMADGTLVDAGTSTIQLTAKNDMILGGLRTANDTATAVVLNSGGSIIDGGDTYLEVEAVNGNLNMTAGGGIGVGNPLEIRVTSVGASAGSSIFINEIDSITLTSLSATGRIGVTAGGAITAASAVTTGGTDSDDIILATTAGDIEVGTINAAGGADVRLTSAAAITDADTNSSVTADDLSFTAAGAVGAAAAPINTTVAEVLSGSSMGAGGIYLNETDALTLTSLNNANGLIDVTAGGVVTAGNVVTTGGTDSDDIILATTAGDIEVGTINAAGDADVSLTSAAAITDADANSSVTGDDLSFTAAGAVGTAGSRINTTVAEVLSGSSTGAGGIYLNETDALTLTSLSKANGSIDVKAGGTLTVDNSGGANAISTVGGGSVTLDANGAASDVRVNDGIRSVNGAITVSADNDIIFEADGDVGSTAGNVRFTADADNGGAASGALTMVDGTVIDAGSGSISLTADGDITLGRLVTTNNSNTAVTLTSTEGGIVDGGDTGGEDVEAATGRLVIDAVTGVGSTGAIETEVASLDIDNATGGNIVMAETDALTVFKAAQATAGNIQVATGGTLTVDNAGAGNAVTTVGPGTVSLDANGTTSDMLVNDGIQSVNGRILLTADDRVTVSNTLESVTGDINISGKAINSNAQITTSGNVAISGTDNITINGVIAPNTVSLSSQDDIAISSLVSAVDRTTVTAGTDGSGDLIIKPNAELKTTGNGSNMELTAGNRILLDGKVETKENLILTAQNGVIDGQDQSGTFSAEKADIKAQTLGIEHAPTADVSDFTITLSQKTNINLSGQMFETSRLDAFPPPSAVILPEPAVFILLNSGNTYGLGSLGTEVIPQATSQQIRLEQVMQRALRAEFFREESVIIEIAYADLAEELEEELEELEEEEEQLEEESVLIEEDEVPVESDN